MCADCYLHAAELDGLSEKETVSTVELTWCIYVFVSSSCEFPCVREKNLVLVLYLPELNAEYTHVSHKQIHILKKVKNV